MARLALALYPPAWRDRYGDEVLAMVAESGGGTRAAASLAWRAVPAWICPPRHLYEDRAARMRASLATVLVSWSVLAGLCLVFDQVTQQQHVVPPLFSYGSWKTPTSLIIWDGSYADIVTWSYRVFDAGLAASALAMLVGGLPLWLVMLRRAWRAPQRRDLIRLLMPVLAPASYLTAVGITVTLLHSPGGVSPSWFLVFLLTGFVAATAAATGPGLALRSLMPRGPAIRFASRAAALGVACVCIAALASGTAAVTLYLFAMGPGNLSSPRARHLIVKGPLLGQPWVNAAALVTYLTMVAAVAAVAAVSASRGARAALTAPGLVQR